MTLAETTAHFLVEASNNESTVRSHLQPAILHASLSLLTSGFPPDASLREITPSKLRDFLSRWYVEDSSGSKPRHSQSVQRDSASADSRTHYVMNAKGTAQVPQPLDLLDSLEEFFKWSDQQAGATQAAELSPILIELRQTLPRALAITNALSSALQQRGGAFHFPEFLTSFEEGGSSQYDIDVPGNVGALDGYFRIVRMERSLVEAEELISEQRVWPIVFPPDVAVLLECGYIISLELVRAAEGWQIAGCGFAYPPGTEIG